MRSVYQTLFPLLLAANLNFAVGCGDSSEEDTGATDEDAGPDEGKSDEGTPEDTSVEAVCPTHLRLENVAGGSRSDLGWRGVGHDLRVNDGAITSVELFNCEVETRDNNPVCTRCQVRGPVLNINVNEDRAIDDGGIDNQRCLNDTRVTCRSDADCQDFGVDEPSTPKRCRFIQGPPLALLTGGIPSCTVVHFVEQVEEGAFPIEGRIDLATGRMSFARFHVLSTANRVPNAEGFLPGGTCAICQNDPVPNDGNKEGTCVLNSAAGLGDASDAIGQPCDTNGFGSVFTGDASFDCGVTRAQDSIEFDVRDFGTTGEVWSLDEERPMCSDGSGDRCWCGVCDNDVSIPCARDRDCPSGGSCGGFDLARGVFPTTASQCLNECAYDPSAARGGCAAREARLPPTPATPEGQVFLPEGTVVGCFPSNEGAEITAPGGQRVISPGEAYEVTLGALNCLGASSTVSTSFAFGLPGPAMYTQRYRVTTEFRNNP